MNTKFFSQIEALNLTGDLKLTISKGAENNFIVSVILQNDQCGDNAKRLIPPYNLRGSTAELDEGFFQNITTPLKETSGLMVNMEAYMKQLEEVKKQSAIEKDKTDKLKKEKEAKEKKLKEAMEKVDELEKAGKYRDAWMKVPDAAEFPDHAENIRKRKASLSQKFSPDLFGSTIEETPAADKIAEPQDDKYTEELEDDNYMDEEPQEDDEEQ